MEIVNIIVNDTVENVSISVTETVQEVAVNVSEAVAGLSAYQIAVVHGYSGTEEEWISMFSDPLYRRIWEQETEPTDELGAKDGDLWIKTIPA